MRSIRKNIFETNSSSVHTLTFKSDGLEKSHLPVNKSGYTLAYYGEFGREDAYYFTQEEKLSYLVTLIWYYDCDYIDESEDSDLRKIGRAHV